MWDGAGLCNLGCTCTGGTPGAACLVQFMPQADRRTNKINLERAPQPQDQSRAEATTTKRTTHEDQPRAEATTTNCTTHKDQPRAGAQNTHNTPTSSGRRSYRMHSTLGSISREFSEPRRTGMQRRRTAGTGPRTHSPSWLIEATTIEGVPSSLAGILQQAGHRQMRAQHTPCVCHRSRKRVHGPSRPRAMCGRCKDTWTTQPKVEPLFQA